MTAGDGRLLGVVAMAAQGPEDPSFRIRVALPGRALASHGVALREMPLFSAGQVARFRGARPVGKAAILARARQRLRRELCELDGGLDTVLVQCRVDLAPSLALERAASEGRRLIYDIDDAVWLSGRQTEGHVLSFLKGAARKVRWLAERADHVIAGSEILAEHLGRYADAITVVPSIVDPATYAVREHSQAPAITLGWIGSPTTARYLDDLAPVLERFARQAARPVRLVVVGGAAPTLRQVEVDQRRWSPEAERGALAEMDIGLMPLKDTHWTRGKCAYKALQYMASGVPPLVSNVGVSAAVVGDAGFAASDDGQWLEGLHALALDASLRAQKGVVGRHRVERDFSYARWIPTLGQIIRS
ncbi:MAG TPA: glycosyltransferase [Solirubrobacteraceae bacterium]|nr:glycosyltransferase [Solirubrobacteraceae bacterium]